MVMMEGEQGAHSSPTVSWCRVWYLLIYFEARRCGVGALSRWGGRWIAHSSVMAIFRAWLLLETNTEHMSSDFWKDRPHHLHT